MKISIEKDLERLFGPLFKRGINRKARRRKGKKATNHITVGEALNQWAIKRTSQGLWFRLRYAIIEHTNDRGIN